MRTEINEESKGDIKKEVKINHAVDEERSLFPVHDYSTIWHINYNREITREDPKEILCDSGASAVIFNERVQHI
jgi:hypothetical protein